MRLKIGTFNLNNLFSRFNFEFRAEVPELKEGSVEFKKVQKLVSGMDAPSVEYEGVALKRKEAVVRRIETMDLDILAVQEVEDIETLRYFVSHELNMPGMYPHIILVEGNDPRLIDLAVLSKYPIGAVTTWQHVVHPDRPRTHRSPASHKDPEDYARDRQALEEDRLRDGVHATDREALRDYREEADARNTDQESR